VTSPSHPSAAIGPHPVGAEPRSDVRFGGRFGGVAVIIAAWRAADTIGRAVASALAQPETVEVVVADDASDDGGATLNAARAADDGTGRLNLLTLDRNAGPGGARNAAIRASTAPWIAILDSDDYFLPGRLDAMFSASGGDCDLIADDLTQLPYGADLSQGQRLWFRDPGQAAPQSLDISLASFVAGNLPDPARPRGELGFIKPVLRRAFLEAHGLSYAESMRLGEDYDLYARLLAAGGRARLFPVSGYVGILRPGSLSDTRRRVDLVNFLAADDRLLSQPTLDPAERAVLGKHRHTIARLIAWIDFIDALKRKRIGEALGVVARYPAGTPHILGHLWNVARKRLSPNAG
jgi:succinoglycan biosynthesis protein ExoU